jgi:hypothetical protein
LGGRLEFSAARVFFGQNPSSARAERAP